MIFENGLLRTLGWLEYSLKRSLWIECTEEHEQQMGTEQVTETINTLNVMLLGFLIGQWLNDKSSK
ncbi:MAG: hypothetical protein ACQEXX_27380 [Bacillota bacterium]